MSEQALPVEQPKKQTGQPSVYGPIVVGKLIGAFQLGLSVGTACDIAGINPDTFYQWMNKHDDFAEKITTARTYAKVLAAQQIQDVLQDVTRGKKDPKTGQVTEKPKYSETTRVTTARWWLEKTEKEVFGSQSVTRKVSSSIGVIVSYGLRARPPPHVPTGGPAHITVMG